MRVQKNLCNSRFQSFTIVSILATPNCHNKDEWNHNITSHTEYQLHHEWHWLAAITTYWLYQVPMVGISHLLHISGKYLDRIFRKAVGDHIHAVSWHLRNIASQSCQSFEPPQACDHKLQARLDELYSWIVIQYCACWYTSETIANYKHQSFPQVLVNCTFWKASNDTVQWHLLQFVYSNPDGGKHQENHCLWLLQCAQPKILYTYKLSLLFLRIYQDYECSNTGLISIPGSKLPAAL